MKTLEELKEMLKQRKKEVEELRLELAEVWLSSYLSNRERRKLANVIKNYEIRLEEAEALLYPLDHHVGF